MIDVAKLPDFVASESTHKSSENRGWLRGRLPLLRKEGKSHRRNGICLLQPAALQSLELDIRLVQHTRHDCNFVKRIGTCCWRASFVRNHFGKRRGHKGVLTFQTKQGRRSRGTLKRKIYYPYAHVAHKWSNVWLATIDTASKKQRYYCRQSMIPMLGFALAPNDSLDRAKPGLRCT